MGKIRNMPKGMKRFIVLALCAVVIGGGAWAITSQTGGEVYGDVTYLTTEMRPTTIRNMISGSSSLTANDTAEVRNAVSGKVAEILVHNGDYVEKDQPLYRLSNDTLLTSLQQAQVDLATAQNTYDRLVMQNSNAAGELKDAQLAVEQKQNALTTQLNNADNLSVYATEDGHITEVNAKVGDTLSANTALFGFYSLEQEDQRNHQIQLQQAKANLDSKRQDYEKLTIVADYAGQVSDLSVKTGETVAANALLLNLTEPDRLSETTDSATSLKIRQAQLSLENAKSDLDSLEVTAPATGMISDLKLLPGDKVTTSTALAAINDNRQVIVNVNVTQSYINGVARGNKAEVMITNSARTYQGIVTDVSPTGTMNTNNVVSYPVEITIDNDGTLLAGMSALVSISSSDATFKSVSSLRGTLSNDLTKTMTPSVSGEIVELRAQNGDWVLEGQVVAVLKNESIELAYEQAQENLKQLLQDEFRAPGLAVVEAIHVQNGDWVEEGQLLMTLQSDSVEAAYLQAETDYQKLLNRETGNTELRTKTAGTLEGLYVQVGDSVKSGQLLAELSSSDIHYQVERAQTDLQQTKAQLEALIQNTSAGEIELARLKLEQASLTVESRQKSVDDLTIRANISGNYTEATSVTVGDELESLTKLGSLYDYSAFKLVINVDELDIPKLKIGREAYVTVDAFAGTTYTGSVAEIAREGNATQGGSGSTFPVTIKFSSDDDLRSAMTATAEIVLEQAENTFAVVKSALTTIERGDETIYGVNLLVDDQQQFVEVEVGIITSSMAEIVSGVQEGDRVVTGSVDAAGDFASSGGTVSGFGGMGGMGGNVMMPAGGGGGMGGSGGPSGNRQGGR